MDRYSILDRSNAQVVPEEIAATGERPQPRIVAPEPSREPLRFPGGDGGRSLAETALRDLESTLQLLVERAQYITGATGAAIALREGTDMICRASAGPSAPELGAHLQVNSGLSGESVRTKQILRCDDAETDGRVNRESCRALGIASVVVLPLEHENEVNGVFELFSNRAYAFEGRDISALQRLAEMIQTAVEHAEAAQRAELEIAAKDETRNAESSSSSGAQASTKTQMAIDDDDEPGFATAAVAEKVSPTAEASGPSPVSRGPDDVPAPVEAIKFRKCEACGFPVSEGRTLCIDCESAHPGAATPEFLSELSETTNPGWLLSHKFVLGMLIAAVITAVIVFLRFY